MKADQLQSNEYGKYYQKYIALADDDDIITGLQSNLKNTLDFIGSLSEEQMNFAYAEGKWTIKEMIVHLIDSERIFSYRVLRFGRGDKTNIPGYEHNDYVEQSEANKRNKANILEEYQAVRKASIALFNSLSDDRLKIIGTANNTPASGRALGFIIVGHERHHTNIIKERYL